jgi:hypothetical protein
MFTLWDYTNPWSLNKESIFPPYQCPGNVIPMSSTVHHKFHKVHGDVVICRLPQFKGICSHCIWHQHPKTRCSVLQNGICVLFQLPSTDLDWPFENHGHPTFPWTEQTWLLLRFPSSSPVLEDRLSIKVMAFLIFTPQNKYASLQLLFKNRV